MRNIWLKIKKSIKFVKILFYWRMCYWNDVKSMFKNEFFFSEEYGLNRALFRNRFYMFRTVIYIEHSRLRFIHVSAILLECSFEFFQWNILVYCCYSLIHASFHYILEPSIYSFKQYFPRFTEVQNVLRLHHPPATLAVHEPQLTSLIHG